MYRNCCRPGRLLFIVFFICALFVIAGCQENHSSKQTNSLNSSKNWQQDTLEIEGLLRKARGSESDPGLAEKYYREAYQLSLKKKYNDGVVFAIFGITARFFEEGKFDSCEHYYAMAARHAEHPIFNRKTKPVLFLNKGTFYYLQGDMQKADEHYFTALKTLSELKLKDDDLKIMLLYNLHFTRNAIQQPQQSLDYLDQALQIALSYPDTERQKQIYMAKAVIHGGLKNMDSAVTYLNRGLALVKGEMSTEDISVASYIYAETGLTQKAIPLLKKGLAVARKYKVDYKHIGYAKQLGIIYNDQKRYREAEALLSPALAEAISKEFRMEVEPLYAALRVSYEGQGNYQKALEMEKLRGRIKDSLLNASNTKALTELDLKYKTTQKNKVISENQLKIAEQQNKIFRQNLIIVCSIIGLLLLGTVLLFVRRASRQRAALDKERIRSLKHQEEIALLKARMDGEEEERKRIAAELHDGIGGMLSGAIRHFDDLKRQHPSMGNSIAAQYLTDILSEASTDLRSTSRKLMPDVLTKLGLAGAIKNYCNSLHKPVLLNLEVRTFGDFTILDYKFQLSVYRVIQELVHNMIRHAEASYGLVQLSINDDSLVITIEDDGIGIDSTAHTGLGLGSISSRIRQLGGDIHIQTDPSSGTSINIEFSVKPILA